MKLEGYRCEACGAETYDKPGEWFEVMSARVSHSKTGALGKVNELPRWNPTWEATFSTPTHYCSPDCIRAAFEPSKPSNRQSKASK